MKTNLLFKRQISVDGCVTMLLKSIPVDIDINPGEGWVFCGYADRFDTENLILDKDPVELKVEKTALPVGSKFESSVMGTAKLVRAKEKIFISYRRGKTTYNQTAPNSICISDSAKNEFFKACHDRFGRLVDTYGFDEKKDPVAYAYWNTWMDKEYKRQLDMFNSN